MSEQVAALVKVLAAHEFTVHKAAEPIIDDQPWRMTDTVWGCTCGWVGDDASLFYETRGEAHRTHVATTLLAATAPTPEHNHATGRFQPAKPGCPACATAPTPDEVGLVEGALDRAAERIEQELICCDTDDPTQVERGHHICRWGIAARNLVLEQKP